MEMKYKNWSTQTAKTSSIGEKLEVITKKHHYHVASPVHCVSLVDVEWRSCLTCAINGRYAERTHLILMLRNVRKQTTMFSFFVKNYRQSKERKIKTKAKKKAKKQKRGENILLFSTIESVLDRFLQHCSLFGISVFERKRTDDFAIVVGIALVGLNGNDIRRRRRHTHIFTHI